MNSFMKKTHQILNRVIYDNIFATQRPAIEFIALIDILMTLLDTFLNLPKFSRQIKHICVELPSIFR